MPIARRSAMLHNWDGTNWGENVHLKRHTLLSLNIREHLSGQKKLLSFTKEWRWYMILWRLWFHALWLKLNLLFHLIEVCSSVLTLGYLMILYMQKLLREGCCLEMKSIKAHQKQNRSTPTRYHRSTLTLHHRSTLPLIHRSTLGAYQCRRSSMCVEILGMEILPHDQTSLGERRGGIERREKGSWVILSYHWSPTSQMVSENPECVADASHSHLQSFKHSLLLRW